MTDVLEVEADEGRKVVCPLVHLNGTPWDRLMSQLTGAANALRDAVLALDEAAPNARDYYTLGDGAFARAAHEHRMRLTWVQRALRDVEAMRMGVCDQERRP